MRPPIFCRLRLRMVFHYLHHKHQVYTLCFPLCIDSVVYRPPSYNGHDILYRWCSKSVFLPLLIRHHRCSHTSDVRGCPFNFNCFCAFIHTLAHVGVLWVDSPFLPFSFCHFVYERRILFCNRNHEHKRFLPCCLSIRVFVRSFAGKRQASYSGR